MQRRHHQVGSINQRLIKLKQGQKTAFPFPLMVSPCLEKGKHSSLPYTPIPIRFLSPYILLYAVSEPRSSICTLFYSHVYGFCFTPFFYLWFLCQSESNFINVFFHRRASHLRSGVKLASAFVRFVYLWICVVSIVRAETTICAEMAQLKPKFHKNGHFPNFADLL